MSNDKGREATTIRTLGEDLPRVMAKVRDEIIPLYEEIGIAGRPALFFMRRDLDAATKAMISGDVVEMIRVYQSLKGYKV